MTFTPRQSGVTMIELVIGLTIAAILATIAAPSFSRFINDTRQSSTITELVSALNHARSEAIKRNTWVLVCPRDATGNDCGTNWTNGWVVCHVDTSASESCSASTTDNPNPIAIHQAINLNLTLTGSTAIIRFNPNGTQGNGGAATLTLNGTWSGAQSKVSRIAATGHISRP